MGKKEMDRLAKAAAALDWALGERNDAIRAARAAGHSLRAIAEVSGVAHETVNRLCRQEEEQQ